MRSAVPLITNNADSASARFNAMFLFRIKMPETLKKIATLALPKLFRPSGRIGFARKSQGFCGARPQADEQGRKEFLPR